jgi:predicted dehydrogenase
MSTVHVALAGIAGYGDSYLQALLSKQSENGMRIVGVVDPAPSRSMRLEELKQRRIPVYDNLVALFGENRIDLMMIVTPIHLHAPHTCFALQHGANVLCEKPVAGTVKDAMKMLEVQQATRKFAAIGYQWSFSEAIQSLKRDVMSGLLGRPIRMRALAFFPRPVSYFNRNNWVGRKRMESGEGVFDSPVNNATAHYLHNMLYLLGKTRETSASPLDVEAELYRANDIENYDTAALRCHSECGAEILFYTTLAASGRHGPRSVYEFEDAIVEHDAGETGQFVAQFRDGRSKCYGTPNHDPEEKIRQCVESARTDAPVACGISAALPHVLCVAAAQDSVPAIVEFPKQLCHRLGMDGDTMICVEGLREALSEAYQRGKLPNELGAWAWAKPGARVELKKAATPRRASQAVHA